MNNLEVSGTNRVILSGNLAGDPVYTHSVYGEGFYEMTLSVPRLSEHNDILPITISERLLSGGDAKNGGQIAISGQFRSYNKIIDEKSRLLLTVFVREILSEAPKTTNSIELEGYICKPPIYRMTPFKREICDILLAVNRAYNKSDYIPCIAWGRNARFVRDCAVGQKVFVSGRVQSREYQKKLAGETFETRTAYEISVNKIATHAFFEPGSGAFSAAEGEKDYGGDRDNEERQQADH